MIVSKNSANLSVDLRMANDWHSHEYVVRGTRYVNGDLIGSEIIHNRSEAIKLRNNLTRLLKATAPPPKKRKA